MKRLTLSRTTLPRTRFFSPARRTHLTHFCTHPPHLHANRTPQQVRFSYSNGNARNDHALLHYGFVNRDRAAEPLLACVDEPGGDLWACPDAEVGLLARAEKLNEKGE